MRFIPDRGLGDSSGRDLGSRIRALDGGASSSTRVSDDPVSYGRREGSLWTELRLRDARETRTTPRPDRTLRSVILIPPSGVFRKFATTSPFR